MLSCEWPKWYDYATVLECHLINPLVRLPGYRFNALIDSHCKEWYTWVHTAHHHQDR